MNQTSTAHIVARDIAALIDVPPALATAMDAHAAAVEAGAVPTLDAPFECMTIGADQVADLVARLARQQAEQAMLPTARGEVLDLLARRILREIAVAGPAIIDALRPQFLTAAEVYQNAVGALPADTRPEAMVRAGSGVVALHEQAVAAAATLNNLRSIRDSIADLGVRPPGEPRIEQWTRYLDLESADAIDWAQRGRSSGPLGRWQGWLAAAGVRRLWWPTLEEQAEAIARISATLPKRTPKKDPTIHLRGPKVA